MRSLHWSVHPNGRLEVDVHGLDAVELRGVEDGAVIAGGDDGRQQSPPSERRSDFHCVLNHRGRRRDARNMDRLSRTIISATCWSDTPGLRSSMRASR